jgi:hypothetical protein
MHPVATAGASKELAMAHFRAKNPKVPGQTLEILTELPVFKHSIVLRSVQPIRQSWHENSPDVYIASSLK